MSVNKHEPSERVEDIDQHGHHLHRPHLIHQEARVTKIDDGEDEVAEEAIGGTNAELPMGYYKSWSFIGTVIALALGNNATYLGFVLPANLLTLINEDIGPDPNYIWAALVWTLMISVSFLLTGRLSDILGRRWFLIGGNIIGLIGTIIGATAQSINQLIAGNAFVGVASAVQLSFTIVISELLPAKWRAYGIGALFFTSLPFAAFGPVIARSFVEHTKAGWRWSYYLNIIVTGLTVIMLFIFFHPPSFDMLHTKRSKREIMRTLDYGGIILFMAGLIMFLIGISWGGVIHPWKSADVIGMIIGGVATLGVFVLWEIFVIKKPENQLVPMHLFLNRGYVGAILTAAIGSCVYYSLNVLWPIQITVLYETSPIMIGWWSCVIGAGAVIGQSLCGIFCKLLGKQKWQFVFTTCGLVAFTGGMAAATIHTRAMAVSFVLLASVMLGYLENVAFTIASFCLPAKDLGLALGLLGCVRSSIACIAQAVFVTVLTNRLTTQVPKYVAPAVTDAGLPATSLPDVFKALAGTVKFTAVPGITPTIIEAAVAANKEAYTQSFKTVYLVALAFGGVGIIASMNAPNIEKFFTEDISRRLHGKGIDNKASKNIDNAPIEEKV